MRCHFKILIIATCVVGVLPVAARGDDETLDYFKRFLDSSPRTEQKSTDLADDWINKVTRSQDSSSSEVESLREPIRVAQKSTRAAVPRPAVPVPRPAPRSTVSDPIPTPQADPISQSQVAELSEADMRAAKQLEAKVNRQVQNLQVQLEREEKALEQQLATFGKRRQVALEKADEKELERIEKLEQTAVVSLKSESSV